MLRRSIKLVPGIAHSMVHPGLGEMRLEETIYNSRFTSPTEITVTIEIRKGELFGDVLNFEQLEKNWKQGLPGHIRAVEVPYSQMKKGEELIGQDAIIEIEMKSDGDYEKFHNRNISEIKYGVGKKLLHHNAEQIVRYTRYYPKFVPEDVLISNDDPSDIMFEEEAYSILDEKTHPILEKQVHSYIWWKMKMKLQEIHSVNTDVAEQLPEDDLIDEIFRSRNYQFSCELEREMKKIDFISRYGKLGFKIPLLEVEEEHINTRTVPAKPDFKPVIQENTLQPIKHEATLPKQDSKVRDFIFSAIIYCIVGAIAIWWLTIIAKSIRQMIYQLTELITPAVIIIGIVVVYRMIKSKGNI